VSTTVCSRCGGSLAPTTLHGLDSLADLPGAEQPPEAAGWLAGATPFDAQVGSDSGPVEYHDPALLCDTCRSQTAGDA